MQEAELDSGDFTLMTEWIEDNILGIAGLGMTGITGVLLFLKLRKWRKAEKIDVSDDEDFFVYFRRRFFAALIIGFLGLAIGTPLCARLIETAEGRIFLNYLNWFSFILGWVYMIQTVFRGNLLRLGFGFVLIVLAIGNPIFREPFHSGAQLFFGVTGLFVPSPRRRRRL